MENMLQEGYVYPKDITILLRKSEQSSMCHV